MPRKKQQVKMTNEVPYERLRLLLICAYMMGQEDGLNGKLYSHPESIRKRENLIEFLYNGELKT